MSSGSHGICAVDVVLAYAWVLSLLAVIVRSRTVRIGKKALSFVEISLILFVSFNVVGVRSRRASAVIHRLSLPKTEFGSRGLHHLAVWAIIVS